METADDVDEAVKAVDYYTHAFPGNIHGDELRWILAERIRYLSQRGGSEQAAALRHQAQQQYEQLESTKGSFAEKAHDAMANPPSASRSGLHASPHVPARNADELQVIGGEDGGSGTQATSVMSTAHEVLVLNQAQVIVRAGTLSQLTVGAAISGRVEHPVKMNGIVVIPVGAPCQLTVVSTSSSGTNVSLGLTSIDIGHRTYPVKSLPVKISSGKGVPLTTDHPLVFHLNASLLIER